MSLAQGLEAAPQRKLRRENRLSQRILIVGSGFFGAVCARELTDAGNSVLVLEEREHIGGNCFTRFVPEADCHQHIYGPHIFHTNDPSVWAYVNRFVEFNNFVNRPRVNYRGGLYSFPINLFTMYQVFGVKTPEEARARIEQERVPIEKPNSLEEWCLSQIGPTLYRMFIQGYTVKQWQTDPRKLPASIIRRLPVRFTFDDNHFRDRYQGIPIGGYTQIFGRLLDGVPVECGVNFLEDRDRWLNRYDHVIYTGALDRFFDFEYGDLEYRSLRFDSELVPLNDFQGNAIINYTEAEVPYTRIVEHKHFDQSLSASKTLVTREYSVTWNRRLIPYYPINTEENQERYRRYRDELKKLELPMSIGGRLAEYRYYDMHQVVAGALKLSASLLRSD